MCHSFSGTLACCLCTAASLVSVICSGGCSSGRESKTGYQANAASTPRAGSNPAVPQKQAASPEPRKAQTQPPSAEAKARESTNVGRVPAASAPSDPEAYRARARASFAKGDIEAALTDLNAALALDPTRWETWSDRGVVYEKKRDLPRAIDDYTKAIELNSNEVKLYMQRGVARYNQIGTPLQPGSIVVQYTPRDVHMAIADFDKVIELRPDLPDSYYNKGRLYEFLGGLLYRPQATAALKKFIEIAPPKYKDQIEDANRRLKALGG